MLLICLPLIKYKDKNKMEDLSSLIEPNDLFELLQNEQSFIEKFRLLEANFGKIAKNDGNDYQKYKTKLNVN